MRRVAVMVGLVVAALAACGKGKDPGAKRGVARAISKKLAFEAYPQYAMKPGNAGRCPGADDLAAYVGEKPGFTDPWGAPYRVVCDGPQGITVSSSGPDGSAGTDDDVGSNDH